MSMVVQHNMQAANANRMLGITSGAQAKSTEKLSSGYKINRAADDAAGLTISEKMRKQIRGLDKASSNAQDGVSSVQTAEGALTEVHSMLQRMNELAVQAANGTNSKDTDRKAIQDEIDQLNTEIDRVAETTKFNEIYLLKGDDGEKTINMKAHDAGLKGTLTDNGDGTATFTMKELNDGDTVSIGGKNYTIGSKEADAKALIEAPANGDPDKTFTIGDKTFKVKANGDVCDKDGNKLYVKTAGGATAAEAFDTSKELTTDSTFKNNANTDTANTAVTVANLKDYVKGGVKVSDGTTTMTVLTDAKDASGAAGADGVDDNDNSVISAEKAYSLAKDELVAANHIGDTENTAAVAQDTTNKNVFTITTGSAKVANTLSFSLHVGADADMTAQPEQMEQEIDEAVSEALSSYQFSADNFNSMTSVLRGIGEQGDKSIVTVSSGKQDTDIFGNPVENTGDYAGAVIAESDGEFLIFTYADAVRAADSINVRFSDGTKIAGTVRQIDEVLGMAVVAVPSDNLPEEERKKVQVLSLANSYTVKAGDVLVGIGGPSGQVHSLSFGTVSYVARNVQITDGLTRILYADISSNSQTGTFLINTAGEMVGWTSESCRNESCTDRTAAYTISSYKPILERLTNGVSAAYLGILGQDVSRAMQGSGIPAGVYVTEAVSGSPAYDAGIQPGDIIVKFGTKEIGSFKDLQAQIENSASGVSVSVNVMRKGRDGYTEIPFLVSLRAR